MRPLATLVLSSLLAVTALADRKGSGSAGERVVPARVIKVEGGVLHVGMGDGQRDVIVPTNDKTEILLDGERVKLADLTPGLAAQITQVDGVTTSIECKRSGRKR